ncbi:hypothetical protein [Pseudomonas paraveronii]|uniref:hypothetical protein n=1 Tax=Pseudomonas paraveronii TaxID=3040598 RepID=UPI002AAF3C41|nr:hypothetical protein [Pseudomonas sp. V3/K/3/5]
MVRFGPAAPTIERPEGAHSMAANRHALSIRQQQFITIMPFGTAAFALKQNKTHIKQLDSYMAQSLQ